MVITILTIVIVGIMGLIYLSINKVYFTQKQISKLSLLPGYSNIWAYCRMDSIDFFCWLTILLSLELTILGLIGIETRRTIFPLIAYSISAIIFYIRAIPNIKLCISETICTTISLGLVIFFAIYN